MKIELEISFKNVRAERYRAFDGAEAEELFFSFDCKGYSGSFFSHISPVYLMLRPENALLRIPLFSGELKLFFDNVADYYYLPDEDMAIHKSVASFVDKNHRIKATASNCYVRKKGLFIPGGLPSEKDAPPAVHEYRESRKDRLFWIEFDESILTQKERSGKYLRSVLNLPGLLPEPYSFS